MTAGSRTLDELERLVACAERLETLGDAVDERLEHGLQRREPLERVMPDLLETLAERLGATGAAVRTFDESLSERTFSFGAAALDAGLLARTSARERLELGPRVVLAHRLDVAGETIGRAFAFFDKTKPAPADGPALLARFSELLDNHLAAIAHARRQFEVIRAISDALKEPVLDEGISRAIEIVRRNVGFSDLVLMFRHEDPMELGGLRYVVYKDGALAHSSEHQRDASLHRFLHGQAQAFLDGDDAELRARFGIQRYREEVLITGVRSARVVGRIIVTSAQGEFHTYDRELLDRFADYLRQRIVDFNREWRDLSRMFSPVVCERLLREEGYRDRYLTPRDHEIAILYCDIAGFTRISERVLRRPDAIGRLIDTWSDRVVGALWEHGGVFDKMVGDCVIGLFGPPFFESTARQRCEGAIGAARKIRELTRALTNDPQIPELRDSAIPLDVAIGINHCPVSVGLFGPDENYTAFSSGMNAAARLQGVATAGEILCMDSLVRVLDRDADFGPERTAEVKNVADPLRFRALNG
ncbi:MAG: adenylate/guanylate cyclase domain-containing protein [Sandaracinaceae bacterium]